MRWSYSSLDLYMQCPRKYKFRYIDRYYPIGENDNRVLGTQVHEALEEIHKVGARIAVPREVDNYRDAARWALIEGYQRFHGCQVLEHTELKLEIDIGGVPMVVKIDGYHNKRVIEHKTSSATGDFFWNKKATDAQPCIYILGGREHGIDIDGCTFNVLKKPGKPKRNETPQEFYDRVRGDMADRPEFYFERKTFYRTDKELEATVEDIQAIHHNITTNQHFPRNVRACHDFGTKCEYYAVCHEGEVIHESRLYRKRPEKAPSDLHV